MKSKTIFYVLGVTLCLLAIPAIGMCFFNDIHWGVLDFLVMGSMFFITAISVSIVWKKVTRKKLRAVMTLLIVFLFLVIWAELAVGLFNSPFAGD